MGKMVDMKYSAKEKKERNSPGKPLDYTSSDGPDYPYGLNINLEHEHLEKLGMSKLPKVGDTMRVNAKAVVTSVSQSEKHNGKPNRRVELQFQHLGVNPHEAESAKEAIDDALDD